MELVLFLQLLCSWGYKCEYVSMSKICNDTRAADHVAPGLLALFLHTASDQKPDVRKGERPLEKSLQYQALEDIR